MMGHGYGVWRVAALVVQLEFMCARTVMAGWLHVLFLNVFPDAFFHAVEKE